MSCQCLLMDAKTEAGASKTISDLAQQLRLHQPYLSGSYDRPPRLQTDRRAAVLICIFEGDNGELRVILTQRSSTLSSHSGEVALPGGKMEEGDKDEVATALREANEEIGLDPSLVEVVSILEPFSMKDEHRRGVEREWMGSKYLLHYFDYEANGRKYVIFALTAGILIETASRVYQRTPVFVEMKPNFWNRPENATTSSLPK